MNKNDFSIPVEQRKAAAYRAVFCPACKAEVGEECRTPSGKVAKDVHGRRAEFASQCNLVPIV